jgi:SEL1 protein
LEHDHARYRLLIIIVSVVFVEALRPEDAVHEATQLLHHIKASSSRRSALLTQNGFQYYAKQFINSLFFTGPPPATTETTLNPYLADAVKLLEDAANEDNPDAILLLAEMNFFGNWTHPRNFTEAFRRYEQLASLEGNATAQHMVGFMYATGIGGAVKQDQAKATLYYTFAADGGDIRALMTMGYRHHIGIATPRSCEQAVDYYSEVADKAIEYLRSGPPGGHASVKDSYRIADDEGGVYGEGASVSSAGANAKQGGPQSDAHASVEDVLEYLDLMSRKGDFKATFTLGRLHYDGSRTSPRDLNLAKKYFLEVARAVWPRKGKPRTEVAPGVDKLASKAAGYLGRMFLRAEGMQQDFEKARTWFRRGVANGDALSQYSLGLMYLHGYGVPKDSIKASEYFGAAADQDLSAAQVRLGAMFLDAGDVTTATRYFELAARNGHIEAFYYLAELINQGVGRDKSCGMAAIYYKIVAEKAESYVASFNEANEAYAAGDLDTALVAYMLAAEQGFEAAQANVAYILDKSRPRMFSTVLPRLIPFLAQKASDLLDTSIALLYWTRSGKQSNIDSLVKMGDYYLFGLGVEPNSEKAAACYTAAAESLVSAQAMWNLGWMHENGIGIEQDFHLAKRFYDQALETNREAYLPVKLALLKLRARSAWNTLTHGSVKSIEDEPRAPRKPFSLSEWLTRFLENEARMYGDEYEADEWEDQFATGMPGGDDDVYDELGEGFVESFVMIGLALVLGALVVYRRRRQDGRDREERLRRQQGGNAANANGNAGNNAVADGQQEQDQNQQQRQQDDRPGGLFPQPGDPEFLGWAAGGVGH